MDAECPEVELAAELALGIVLGSQRASALAHLGHCSSCRRMVDDLTTVADPLLLLAPPVEPSIGFESRVLAATAAAGADRPNSPPLVPRRPAWPGRRRRTRVLRMAAAVAAVVVAAAGGLVLGRVSGRDPGVRTALVVTANGRSTCRAFAYGDHQAWVFVSLEAPREWTADYTVEVTTVAGGRPTAVGSMKLESGRAALGATVDAPASRLTAVRVLDASGALRYEAPFETS